MNQRNPSKLELGLPPALISKRRALRGLFFGSGFAATGIQVLLLRDLMNAAAGDEVSLGLALGAWLGGISLGAWLNRWSAASEGALFSTGAILLAFSWGLPAMIVGRLLRAWWAPPAGELPGFGLVLGLALCVAFPQGCWIGWAFCRLARIGATVWPTRQVVAVLLAWESLGSALGGLAVSTILLPRAPQGSPILLVSLISFAASAGAFWGGHIPGRFWAALLFVLGMGLFPWSGGIDRWSEAIRFRGVAPGIPFREKCETGYRALILGGDDQLQHLYSSGQYWSSFPDPVGDEQRIHLLACLVPKPRRVLIIGGFQLGLLVPLLKHPVEEVVLLEPDREGFQFLSRRATAETRRLLMDPKVTVLFEDPRHPHPSWTSRFDLILLLSHEPVTIQGSRLTTLEFFRRAATWLTPEGGLVLSLRTAPTALEGETARLTGVLFHTLSLAFLRVSLTPGPDSYFLAGRSAELTLSSDVLSRRWKERGIEAASFSVELFPVLLPAERLAALDSEVRELGRSSPISTDEKPVALHHALARRQQVAGSWAGRLWVGIGRLSPTVLLSACLLPSLLFLGFLTVRKVDTRFERWAILHLMVVTGAAGMSWAMVLILAFQAQVGGLYGHLGWLTSCYMAGLALGARFSGTAKGLGEERRPEDSGRIKKSLAFSLLALAFSLVLSPALNPLGQLAAAGTAWGVGVFSTLLLAAGSLGGSVFSQSARVLDQLGMDPSHGAARLETADHVGAMAGALLLAIVLVPAFGLAQTLFLAGLWIGLGAVGIALCLTKLRLVG